MVKYFWVLLCFWTQMSWAQSDDYAAPDFRFTTAYIHNSTSNPGIQIAAEWTIKELLKAKKSRRDNLGEFQRKRRRQWVAEGRLGFYWDPLSHLAVYNQYLLSYRFVFHKRRTTIPAFSFALSAGPGYQRHFFSETYEVTANDEVIDLGWASRGYFSTVFDLRFIRERQGKKLNAWFIGLNSVFLYNYNATIAPVNNLFFGLRFNFNSPS